MNVSRRRDTFFEKKQKYPSLPISADTFTLIVMGMLAVLLIAWIIQRFL